MNSSYPAKPEKIRIDFSEVDGAIKASYEKQVQYGGTSPLVAIEHDEVANIIVTALQKLAQYSETELNQLIRDVNDIGVMRHEHTLPQSSPLDERLLDVLVRLAAVEYSQVVQVRRPNESPEIEQLTRSNIYRKIASYPFRKLRETKENQAISDVVGELRKKLGLV